MVRRSFTAVIEKNTTWTSDSNTEPYETAWAGEARWFIRVLELKGTGTSLSIAPQISPDGLFWCDEGREPLVISVPGLYSFPLRDFGHWLRLRTHFMGENPSAKMFIYLALKE